MTTPNAPSLESFFSGGGGKSVSWQGKEIGYTVSGVIKAVNPPQQQTDYVTKEPVFKKDGSPKMTVRIDLQTTEREPGDEDDDGTRGLYVQGWLVGAVGDALRKAGRQGPPEVGGTLTVTLTAREPNQENPRLNPTNKFSASYVSPAGAATGQFFAPPAAAPQPSIGGTGYVQPPAPAAAAPPAAGGPLTPEQIAAMLAQPGPAAAAPVAEPEPERPPQMNEATWATLDLAAKKQIAETFKNLPPF